jgi:hypothetical protein
VHETDHRCFVTDVSAGDVKYVLETGFEDEREVLGV